MGSDAKTAAAFAASWNHLPAGSVYTYGQFSEWLAPLTQQDVAGGRVLELGCGNGSLMVHMATWTPSHLEGVDLGDSVQTARTNLASHTHVTVTQADLVSFTAARPYDLVYCIGVLHHLQDPHAGFESVLRNTRPGGRFHCWVYAREGNWLIMNLVDPLRMVASKLPWWVTKYPLATTLVAPFYFYAKLMAALPRWPVLAKLPLYWYACWIAEREFAFFRHVAFDQLVTPQTAYLPRTTIEAWLRNGSIDQASTYLIMRNGNSWKFGGIKRS